MALKIEKAGILDTIQDLGRPGFRKLGINPGGAMDRAAVRIVNLLLENDENAPVIETHFPALDIKFQDKCRFALGGGDFLPTLNGTPVRIWTSQVASPGDLLQFSKRVNGSRAYLAVKGGIEADLWLGGSGTNLFAGVGGFNGRELKKDDLIGYADKRKVSAGEMVNKAQLSIGPGSVPIYSRSPTLQVTKGPEFHRLTAKSANELLKGEFAISNTSDRMGFRLEGDVLTLISDHEIVSAAVDFGTIQLLPNGQLIILMADHQTTGGYPRIGCVVRSDLPIAAQASPGEKFRFELISTSRALRLSRRFEQNLRFLRMGVRFRGI